MDLGCCESFIGFWLLFQSCGLVILVTSSAAVDTVSLNASNVTATPTVWTTQMKHPVVSVLHQLFVPL